jgi:hypothetical protein
VNCPNCTSTNIATHTVTEWIPYGEDQQAFQATFPVYTCNDCEFGWRDYLAEEAIATAMQEYLASSADGLEERVALVTGRIRELLTETIKPTDEREPFREALLLLAAEL